MTAEQQARDMLERMGVKGAQEFASSDLVELANIIVALEDIANYDGHGDKAEDAAHMRNKAYDALRGTRA